MGTAADLTPRPQVTLQPRLDKLANREVIKFDYLLEKEVEIEKLKHKKHKRKTNKISTKLTSESDDNSQIAAC
jgi:hypothetical protein